MGLTRPPGKSITTDLRTAFDGYGVCAVGHGSPSYPCHILDGVPSLEPRRGEVGSHGS